MKLTLPSEIERQLNEKVENGEFESVEAAITDTLRQSLGAGDSNHRVKAQVTPDNISVAVERLRKEADLEVKEALDRLPADLASEHDHYAYGTPKKHS